MLRRLLGLFLVVCAWGYGLSAKAVLILGLIGLFFLFVIVPFVFRMNRTLQRHMVFLPWVHWPKHINFESPDTEGIEGAKNLYLETDKNVEVGVWHILPQCLVAESKGKDKEWFENTLSGGTPIILYMHGNTGSRARDHRLRLYEILQKMNYHIIAFDYRGYADSSPVCPTKTGVVRDARMVYEYVRGVAGPEAKIIVYGHSLGTAVSTEMVSELCQEAGGVGGNQAGLPKGLILESPFNNIHDEVKQHPMTFLWRRMPWFDWFFAGTLTKNDVGFVTDQRIVLVHIPLLILHAKDDAVIPFELGEKLFRVAKEQRSSGSSPVKFVPFEADRCLGHTQIFTAPELTSVVQTFVSETTSRNGDWR